MQKPRFDFLSIAPYLTSFSIFTSFVAVVWIAVQGFNYGIDFVGGSEIQLRFQQPPAIETLRKYISDKGFLKPSVQTCGDEQEVLILVDRTDKNDSTMLEERTRSIQ